MNTLDFSKIDVTGRYDATLPFSGIDQSVRWDQKRRLCEHDVSFEIDPNDEAAHTDKNTGDFDPAVTDLGGSTQGDDALAVLGRVTQTLPALTPEIIKVFMQAEFPDTTRPVLGTLGELFSNTTTRGRTASTSMGVPVEFATRALDALLTFNKSNGPICRHFFPALCKREQRHTRLDPLAFNLRD